MHRPALPTLFAAALLACGPPPAGGPRAAEARFVDASSHETLSFDAVMERVGDADVVYLGERHDRPEDHAMQARIATALARRGTLAVGFEMVQRPYQAALERYAAGEIGEAALLEGVEWETRWGFDFAMYRPAFALGPDGGARLVALNAPRETAHAVARGGLEGLDEATRAALPDLDTDDAEHRAAVSEALAHHPHMDAAILERFYLAQVLWDETMAEAVAATMTGEGAPERMVVLAGTMHVLESAIPARARRRGVASYAIVRPLDEAELASSPPAATVYFVTP